ncbi:predicted protein [Streptomyces viridosporus ATCC 14672]|uniref:Predicted protein n=1 Tax=Streptomyces viridosporus (strain ATCC 14672 / DSM 40746 / JCM 4963 / KCTC 9882 / NRRL B-12104 / FH 1290) TaxID=566461 RepID=D6A4I0_STRV1|nr:hypothetical protein [Streptomyces viridosporus]EFE65820.1 predicted protein [Streptomyces viridosporus ATCC 14672]
MNPAKPAERLPAKPGRRRYISATTERLLADCFPGLVPATVIEDALRQKAIREGRLAAPRRRGGKP